jgi:hypothetical protein
MRTLLSEETSMSKVAQAAAVAMLVFFPLMARGHGLGIRPRAIVAYYCPAPVQFVPVLSYDMYPICVPPPLAVHRSMPPPYAPGATYARPTPATPSAGPSTAEPPLAEPAAPGKTPPLPRSSGLGESTSFYDAYAVASQETAKSSGDSCKVDFWNLTNKDLVLRIDGGAPQVVPRGKSLPVLVGRQFTWQVDGHEMQATPIEGREAALQIVIRR